MKSLFGALRAAAGFFVLFGSFSPAWAQTSFYDGPRSALAGQPGTIVRQERIDGAPLGAAASAVPEVLLPA